MDDSTGLADEWEGPALDLPDLGCLFVELHPRLLRAARAWAPPGTADDVVQDTWAVVVDRIGGFEGRSALSTWVFGVLRRKAARRWRDDRRHHHRFEADRAGGLTSFPPVDRSPWSDPEGRATDRVEVSAVLAAIDELPDRYRDIVVLRDVLDQPAEAAEAHLGISQANQRVRLHRARQQVRRRLRAAEPSR